MKIILIAVGRSKNGPDRDLFLSYTSRLPWPVELKEVEIKKEINNAKRRTLEGQALLEHIPPKAHVVALDERGVSETSTAFAAHMGRWRDDGARTVAFLIGGADGLSDEVRKRADTVLSFGALTWPHMLVRALLVEQLYRAHCILSGHPYHRA
jgi:23S rRNA (pseudouridine1915-N3)-methyltransferase